MSNRCKTEVIELHRFFERWFNGERSTEEEFSRLTSVLADDFLLISPHAARLSRSELITSLKDAQGAYQNPEKSFRIWIENLEVRFVEGDLTLVTYEEWQEINGHINGRLSSVLFRNRSGTPNGVEWLHVHEVALPSE